ncbi:MAG TPA: TolC family protein [Candidatus Limnocylindrales bacterium]|nr:TolC family protein [Candidatus Limnocylindrales bacterium]
MKLRGLIFAVALMGTPARLCAEPRPITLQEAVTLAERNALVVIQAHGQARSSGAAVRSAYGAFLPAVSLTAGATKRYGGGGTRIDSNGQLVTLPSAPWSSNAGLGANVDIFTGGQRFFDLRQAKARETSADVNETASRFSAVLAAKQQFYNVLAARESQAAAASQLEQAQLQRKTAIARTAARVATRSDSLRAEIQYRTAQLAIVDSKNALETANASLTRVVGSPEPVTAAPTELSEHQGLALDDATLRQMALAGPAVQQAKADLDAAKAAQKSAWTDYLPSLSASYSRTGSGSGEAPEFVSSDFSYSGSLRFTATLPLFNQFQREERIIQAKVAQDNAEASMRDARLGAEEAVTQQLGAFRSAEERVISQAATVAAAEEDLRVQQQRYAVGGSTILDVLTSQTQLNEARRDLIRARYDQRVARAQLEALVGREL